MRIPLVSICLLLAAMTAAPSPAKAADPMRIAFVDTGNTGRSVTAEALALAMIRDRRLNIQVISRAFDLNPYDIEPEPNAALLLREKGIDVSAHRAAQLTIQDITHSALILTATAKHKAGIVALFPDAAAKTFTLAEYAGGEMRDVVDAWGQPMEVYQQVFAQILGYLPPVLERATPK